MSEYDEQAQQFLDKYKLTFQVRKLGVVNKWNAERYRYNITITRQDKNGNTLIFKSPFFGSQYDYERGNNDVTPYAFLACISGDQYYTTAKDIISEFGRDAADMDIDAMIQQAKDMKAFFTPAMLRDLGEIR